MRNVSSKTGSAPGIRGILGSVMMAGLVAFAAPGAAFAND